MKTETEVKQYVMSDFKKLDKNHLISNDNKYQLSRDKEGYCYPCEWFYDLAPDEHNFWTSMVHISYDYTFTFEDCLKVLNRVLTGTWLHGKGTFLNKLNETT
jgi:hypothetical protein